MNYRIALIDDELVAMRIYRLELELEGYEVLQYKSVDEIEPLISTEKNEPIDLFIIDIVLPSGSVYSDKNPDLGLRTGLFLAQDIRKKYIDIPIILFTNWQFEDLQKAAKRLSIRLGNCIFLYKHDYLPFELVDMVNRYFKELRLSPKKKIGIFQKLFGSLILQPNISGVGIDLKQLGKEE